MHTLSPLLSSASVYRVLMHLAWHELAGKVSHVYDIRALMIVCARNHTVKHVRDHLHSVCWLGLLCQHTGIEYALSHHCLDTFGAHTALRPGCTAEERHIWVIVVGTRIGSETVEA